MIWRDDFNECRVSGATVLCRSLDFTSREENCCLTSLPSCPAGTQRLLQSSS
jgi:hypothetical protein